MHTLVSGGSAPDGPQAIRGGEARAYIVCQPVVPQRPDVLVRHCAAKMSAPAPAFRSHGFSRCRGVVAYRGCRSLPWSAITPRTQRYSMRSREDSWGTHRRGTARRGSAVAGTPSSACRQRGRIGHPTPDGPAHREPQELERSALTGSPSRRAILDRKVMVARLR